MDLANTVAAGPTPTPRTSLSNTLGPPLTLMSADLVLDVPSAGQSETVLVPCLPTIYIHHGGDDDDDAVGVAPSVASYVARCAVVRPNGGWKRFGSPVGWLGRRRRGSNGRTGMTKWSRGARGDAAAARGLPEPPTAPKSSTLCLVPPTGRHVEASPSLPAGPLAGLKMSMDRDSKVCESLSVAFALSGVHVGHLQVAVHLFNSGNHAVQIGMSVISPQAQGALLRKTTRSGAPARKRPDGALRRPAAGPAGLGVPSTQPWRRRATETLQVFFVRRNALWTRTRR